MSRCARLFAVILLCLLGAHLPSLRATTLVYQSTLELLQLSDLVVVGEVTAIRYEERDGRIYTVITLKVAETWKGQPTAATLEIVEPGGIVGDRGSKTGGIPQYKAGDRVVSFLQKDPADPQQRLRTTGGVPGRHLVVTAPGQPQLDPPVDLLARPASDANCDYAGHNAQGRTILVDYSRMMRIEAAQKTTLDQFRTEVAAYRDALAAGQKPALSARDQAIQQALQAAFEHGHDHAAAHPLPPAGPTLPPVTPPDTAAAEPAAAPRDLGPFVVIREEDIDRILREKQAARQTAALERDTTGRNAWILFSVSGAIFLALTFFVRQRHRAQAAAIDRS